MKKIIAREFLFLLGFGVLVGLIYCTLLLMQYAKKLKVEELSRQAIILKDFQPYKYCGRYSEDDAGVYDDFKELYFDLRSYGITDIDESEFDIFAKFNCRDYSRKNKSTYEEVIKDLFDRAKTLGYPKGMEEFQNLLSSDNHALQVNFNYVKDKGYSKGMEEFSSLLGIGQVKKEEDSELTSPGEGTVLRTPQQMEESTSLESSNHVNDISEDEIKRLFNIMPKGMFSDEQELGDLIKTKGVGVIYSAIPKGVFSSKEKFESSSYSAIRTRVLTFQYKQFSNFYISAKIKLYNEITRVRKKNPFRHLGILVLSLFSLVFLLRYLVYSVMWSIKQLNN
jgi:hypothetical protein